MTKSLSHSQVRRLLDEARNSFPQEACLNCECFLGYLVQLGLDGGVDISSLYTKLGIDYRGAHACLGCEPCPPAELFAGYLQARDQEQ